MQMLFFMEPIKLLLSTMPAGMTLAIGRPLFVIKMPCGSICSRIRRHFALNSLALMVFIFDFM